MGLKMKQNIIKETDYLVKAIKKLFMEIVEGSGADAIFTEVKSKLPKVTMGEAGAINASMYPEAAVVKALKELGYIYKKPMGPKLHFFNKQTSISLYLSQKTRTLTLVP